MAISIPFPVGNLATCFGSRIRKQISEFSIQLAEKAKTDVGGVALDVDGDGWVDQVSGDTWFRNPGKPREAAR
jgi:hypothetical protein